jgi:ureidoacrylate peracid hydrolase
VDTIWGRNVRSELSELWKPADTALIMVDLQNDFCDPRGYYGRTGKRLDEIRLAVLLSAELLTAARAAGLLVVWIKQTLLPNAGADSPSWLRRRTAAGEAPPEWTIEGSWGHDIVAPLDPRADEPVVLKHRSSAFINTDLDLILRSNQIASLVVCGTVTQGCVESTARDATFLDYYVTLAQDCVATVDPQLHQHSIACQATRYDFADAAEIGSFWAAARSSSSFTA